MAKLNVVIVVVVQSVSHAVKDELALQFGHQVAQILVLNIELTLEKFSQFFLSHPDESEFAVH